MIKFLNARYAGSCNVCAARIMRGDKVAYSVPRRAVVCAPCGRRLQAAEAVARERSHEARRAAYATGDGGRDD